jgi:hypothetical protein
MRIDAMTAADPWWKRALRGLRSQWIASALVIPMCFLIVTNHLSSEAAKNARIQSARVDQIVRLQESGKTLDLALAGYFESIAEVGLAERNLRVPGRYQNVPLPQAQATVVQARLGAREALVKHAGDVQALRGTLDQSEAEQYISALAEMSATIDREADISATGQNITVLGKLVVARNNLVDEAMDQVG